MTTRNTAIIETAGALFSRYGFSRVTIGDIAREAGLSRQTVYNAFAGKDEILGAVVGQHLLNLRKSISDAWDQSAGFGEKLDHFMRLGPLTWYDMIEATPDAADMIDGLHRTATVEKQAFYEDISAEITKELMPYKDNLASKGMNPEQVADFIVTSAVNAKYDVKDRETLVLRLDTLRKAAEALIKKNSE